MDQRIEASSPYQSTVAAAAAVVAAAVDMQSASAAFSAGACR